jgi:CRISPR-associated protein Cas1
LDSVEIKIYLDKIDNLMYQLKNNSGLTKESIFGFEGSAANLYFTTIRALGLFPSTFDERTKRYSGEITNVALNYGYAILFNVIYKATINAGLDPYCGILHTLKSGKPSLVLDLMEEYRSFIVDRNIIKNKSKLESCSDFNKVKKDIASSILESLSRKHIYKKQKIMVESIIQKQLYKISGHFACQMKYKPYTFRW